MHTILTKNSLIEQAKLSNGMIMMVAAITTPTIA